MLKSARGKKWKMHQRQTQAIVVLSSASMLKMFYWCSLHLHVIACHCLFSWIKLKIKAHVLTEYSATHVTYKSVQRLVTDTCKRAAAGMAERDTCTLACGSHCSGQLLPSCPYWRWIKISSVHLELIKADQCAAAKASGPFQLCLNCPHELKQLCSSYFSGGNWAHSNQLYWPLSKLYDYYYFFAFKYDSSRHQFVVSFFLHFDELDALNPEPWYFKLEFTFLLIYTWMFSNAKQHFNCCYKSPLFFSFLKLLLTYCNAHI